MDLWCTGSRPSGTSRRPGLRRGPHLLIQGLVDAEGSLIDRQLGCLGPKWEVGYGAVGAW